MNPQQYYQVAVSAGVQELPAHYGQARLLQNAALAGGLHVVPPPPPPAALSVQAEGESSDTKPVAEAECVESGEPQPQDVTKTDPVAEEVDSSAATEIPVASSPTPTKLLTSAVVSVPTQVAMQATAPAGMVGGVGVYAGAYIQQAATPQLAQLPQAVPQYMLANPALQPAAQAQASKVMLLPQYYPGLGASPYLSPAVSAAGGAAMQPTVVTDHTGKTYLVNYQPQQQVQYYVQTPAAAATAGVKASVPGVQLVMGSPQQQQQQQQQQQYYATAAALHAQASASLQPVYARSQAAVPGAQAMTALGAFPAGAVPSAPGAAPAAPLYYYY